MNKQDAQDILGLGNSYNEADVKTAFRRLSKLCHPDVGGTAGLFRLVVEAQKTLTGGTSQQTSRARQASGQTHTAQKPRWNPLLDPNYVCPWNDFVRIILGRDVCLQHQGESFRVTRDMLDYGWLHSEAPVIVEIRLWKNWLSRFLSKPKVIVSQEAAFKNNCLGSMFFDLKLNFAVSTRDTNCYEVLIKAPWAKDESLFRWGGTCTTACSSLPKRQYQSIFGIHFELNSKFTNKSQ